MIQEQINALEKSAATLLIPVEQGGPEDLTEAEADKEARKQLAPQLSLLTRRRRCLRLFSDNWLKWVGAWTRSACWRGSKRSCRLWDVAIRATCSMASQRPRSRPRRSSSIQTVKIPMCRTQSCCQVRVLGGWLNYYSAHAEFVFVLNAADHVLKDRVLNLPESIVAGTHNTEEGMSALSDCHTYSHLINVHVQASTAAWPSTRRATLRTTLLSTSLTCWKFTLPVRLSRCLLTTDHGACRAAGRGLEWDAGGDQEGGGWPA